MPSATLPHALRWLREQAAAMEDDLAALVNLNSFTENVSGGQAVGQRLRDLFRPTGLVCEPRPSPQGRFADHLVFRTAAPGPGVLLVGHSDTVFPPGLFEGYRRDGSLGRGPGVLDMKGGLVVVAYALRALAEAGQLASSPVQVVIVSDEEVGSPEGSGVLREVVAAAAPHVALVFEAGRVGDAIITQRKGVAGLHVIAHGRAAHAGNAHHDGANAIWALARFVDGAQRATHYAAGRTVNVGKITGGTTKNTVPDRAEAWVDLRFVAAHDGPALLAELAHVAAETETEVPGCRLELRELAHRPPLLRLSANVHLAQRYGACARLEGLGDGEATLLGGGSDANTTAALGVASIDGLGPRGKGFHTLDEQIELDTLVPKAAALVRFLAQTWTPPP